MLPPLPMAQQMMAVSHNLKFEERSVPLCPHDMILVRVVAFGVTRADFHSTRVDCGSMGVEFAGYVTEAGSQVAEFEVGDRVAGFTYNGAWANYVVCDPRHVFHIPKRLSMAESSAIPLAWFSAIDALETAGFKKRDKVVVHFGDRSDIAIALVQHAQVVGCRRVFAVTRNQQEYDYVVKNCKLIGALPDELVVLHQSNWAVQVARWDPKGVQIIVSETPIPLSDCGQVLSSGGAVTYLAPASKIQGDVSAVLNKRIRISSFNLRASPPARITAVCDFFKDRIADRFANGRLKPPVTTELGWQETEQALKLAKSSIGAVVCLVK